MANDLTFTQISTVLNEMHQMVTGQTQIAPVNTSQFVNVATNLLQTGYDPFIGAISQVLGRTIFSIRPYTRKFRVLERSVQQYGNHVRKIQAYDSDWTDDDRYKLVDAASIDQYVVRKPKLLQTNFYGMSVRQRWYTLFKDQMDCAVRGPEELGQLITLITSNTSDQIEQAHETLERFTVANYMAGMITLANTGQVVHLLTEYNTKIGSETGKELTLTALAADPAKWIDFIEFCFSRMNTVSDFMTDRGVLFNNPMNGTSIPRHTPKRYQKALFNTGFMNDIATGVRANVYNETFLKMLESEKVNFWQSPLTPASINIKPSYTKADGSVATTTNPVSQANIFGLLFDMEAMGFTVVNQWTAPTPFNARGGYTNIFFHFTDKWWNDWTENAVLFLLD